MATVQEKIELLHEKLAKVKAGGGEKRVEKQHAQGKMTARERLAKLFDDNSFVELDQFVKHRCVNFGQEKKELPGEGVVTGYGTIDGRLVYAFAQDFTVEGGSLGEMHAAKIVKVQRLAMKMGAPIVGINDSGGARIQEAVDALAGYGKIFFENTNASGVIPQISVIMGPCAGGAVYSPALTDFIYMVKNTSQMFITGPAVIKSVTGEEVTAEDLGGAMAHNSVSGVAHFAAENEDDCIAQIRYLLGFLPSNNMEDAPLVDTGDDPTREDESLNSLLPDNSNMPYDMKDVIAATVDNGEYYEVQPFYATNIITCFARFDGQSVGIIANQPKVMAGCLDINASDKSSRFIRFCDAFNIPIVNFVDVPGFLPGTNQEWGGIIRRKAYGGSYLAMCSQDLGADQVYAWPTSEIAVMGPAGAANIIFKKDEDKDAKTAKYVEEFATPYKAAERGFVDVVIEPKQTRPAVINALAMLASKRENRAPKKHGNIPL
ncbi:MAG: carboxyl transferase domain-containing protein [Veillonella sp.]|nr:carboxyl transferase domain-containing protein [Veillonella sp.]